MFLRKVKCCPRWILSRHLPRDGGRWRRLQVPGGSREWWRGSHNIPGGQLICINPPWVPKNNPGEPPANHRRSRDWGGVCVNQRKTCCWGVYIFYNHITVLLYCYFLCIERKQWIKMCSFVILKTKLYTQNSNGVHAKFKFDRFNIIIVSHSLLTDKKSPYFCIIVDYV